VACFPGQGVAGQFTLFPVFQEKDYFYFLKKDKNVTFKKKSKLTCFHNRSTMPLMEYRYCWSPPPGGLQQPFLICFENIFLHFC
jgi:hypothetical protein